METTRNDALLLFIPNPQPPFPFSSGVFINNSSTISLWLWRIYLGFQLLKEIRFALVPLCSASAQCVCSFYPPVYLSVPLSVSGCSCASGATGGSRSSRAIFLFFCIIPGQRVTVTLSPCNRCSLQLAACLPSDHGDAFARNHERQSDGRGGDRKRGL